MVMSSRVVALGQWGSAGRWCLVDEPVSSLVAFSGEL